MTALQLPDGVMEALVVRPGDTLIVRVGSEDTEDLCREFLAKLKAWAAERLPGVEVAVIGDVEQIALYRPDQLSAEARQCST